MNHIYRSVWSETSGTFVAVSEATSSKGKAASSVTGALGSGANNAENNSRSQSVGGFALKSLAGLALLMFGSYALAGPEGGTVTAGQASIATRGTAGASTTTITQTSQNAALNWSSFNTRAGEAVLFVQPSSSAVALNRVLGSDPTSFLGSLSANGKVFLINPSGILFSKGASVSVGGLVASTLDISNSDFMAGRYKFSGSSNASVVNQGSITAADGGYVALLGANVNNQGVISAQMGSVVLAGGKAMTLDVAGDGLLSVSINQGAVDALVSNGGLIQADGGKVLLSAQAAGALLKTVINNTGVIQAQTLQNKAGVIYLLSDMQSGTVNVGGTLDASAPNTGNGGFIETSAAHVNVAPDARVTTLAAKGLNGSWLIDPVDYTVAATGGNQTGAQLSASLSSGNVTILSSNGTAGTAGDIHVNDNVSWNANSLTLNAYNNININSAMNGGAAGKLALQYGQGSVNGIIGTTPATYNVKAPIDLAAGPNFSTQLGSAGPVVNYTVITALGAQGDASTVPATMTLQGIAAPASLTGNYVLGANIDGTPTNTWNSNGAATPVYAGFTPIGNGTSSFTGTFDGLGHTVSSLSINRPTTDIVGLFGSTVSTSVIKNVGLVGGSVTGQNNVGGLVGYNTGGAISNSYVTGAVTGSGGSYIGGLVGYNGGGTISNSYATGAVSGNYFIGGLVGYDYGGTISNSYATGAVSSGGNYYAGGLVGYNASGTISNSYATGAVSGNYAGGLVGINGGTISNSYATGAVSGSTTVGGLVGYNYGTISNSYATGAVSGSGETGGLVGSNYGTVSNSYATGVVSGSSNVGGLVGYNYGTINNSYATGAVSGSGDTGGLVGANYGTISNSYATGAVSGSTTVGGLVGYNNSTISNSYWDSSVNATGIGGGTITGATGLSAAAMRTQSSFTGFDFLNTWFIYQGHTAPLLRTFLTPLTVTANNTTKAYDGLASTATGVTYSVTPNTNLLGTFNWDGAKNVGSYLPSGLYSNQQGYLISYSGGTLTVKPAPLTVSGLAGTSRTYNGSTVDALTGTAVLNGLVTGETLTLGGTTTGTLASANAGSQAVTTAVTIANGNALASNYVLIQPSLANVTIAPAPLTVSGLAGTSRPYSGSIVDALTGTTVLNGLVTGETLTLGGTTTGTLASANAGSQAVTTAIKIANGNALASNYVLIQPSLANVTIAPAPLSSAGLPMPLVDGLYEPMEDALKLIKGMKADTTAAVNNEDKQNLPNKWPTSDFLLTIDPALTVRR